MTMDIASTCCDLFYCDNQWVGKDEENQDVIQLIDHGVCSRIYQLGLSCESYFYFDFEVSGIYILVEVAIHN